MIKKNTEENAVVIYTGYFIREKIFGHHRRSKLVRETNILNLSCIQLFSECFEWLILLWISQYQLSGMTKRKSKFRRNNDPTKKGLYIRDNGYSMSSSWKYFIRL